MWTWTCLQSDYYQFSMNQNVLFSHKPGHKLAHMRCQKTITADFNGHLNMKCTFFHACYPVPDAILHLLPRSIVKQRFLLYVPHNVCLSWQNSKTDLFLKMFKTSWFYLFTPRNFTFALSAVCSFHGDLTFTEDFTLALTAVCSFLGDLAFTEDFTLALTTARCFLRNLVLMALWTQVWKRTCPCV